MNTYTFKHKKVSRYGNDPERTNIVKSENKLDAARAFRGVFGGANKVQILSVKDEDGKELLEK